MIQHDDVKALIEKEIAPKILEAAVQNSQAFKLLTRIKDMNSNELQINVQDSLTTAYYQASNTAQKKISKFSWKGITLTAGEIAVISVIAEADLKDTKFDLEGALRRDVERELTRLIDEGIFFGTGVPSFFPKGLVKQAIENGLSVYKDPSKSAYMLISDAMGEVEEKGYDATAVLGGPSIKKVFRNMVDTTGQLITGDEISALPRAIVKNGAWDKSVAELVTGEFSLGVYSIRQNLEVKVLTEGVLQDENGNIIHNLAQEDKVGFRFTFRYAWGLPVPVNPLDKAAERIPLAAVVPYQVVVGPKSQNFTSSLVVELKANAEGAKIYYTDDGTTPDATDGTEYTGPITLSATKTIKAIAIKSGVADSDVFSATYTKLS